MKTLIIGYGSIGARHGRLLIEAGNEVACVTGNPDCPYPVHANLSIALAEWRPDQILIANQTSRHLSTLRDLIEQGFDGPILVEKPLFGEAVSAGDLPNLEAFVAFNMRFHPLVRKLREKLAGVTLYNATFHVGQYLPDWRPGTDYRTCYSAHRDQGGGVLRDLTHELDLANWLCGSWRRVTALGGKFSNLEIDSDDTYHLLAEMDRCPAVSISLNYLDRTPRRLIAITGDGITATLDLIAGRLEVNGEITAYKADRDETYREQIKAFNQNDPSILCSLAEGSEVDQFLLAAEKAAATNSWIKNDAL